MSTRPSPVEAVVSTNRSPSGLSGAKRPLPSTRTMRYGWASSTWEIAPVPRVSFQASRFRPNHSGRPQGPTSASHNSSHEPMGVDLRSTTRGSPSRTPSLGMVSSMPPTRCCGIPANPPGVSVILRQYRLPNEAAGGAGRMCRSGTRRVRHCAGRVQQFVCDKLSLGHTGLGYGDTRFA